MRRSWQHSGSSEAMVEDDKAIGGTAFSSWKGGVSRPHGIGAGGNGPAARATEGGFGRYFSVERRESQGERVYSVASDVRAVGVSLAY